MNPTEDTITKQFVEGCGITEIAPDQFVAEPIRAMTPEEIKEREVLNQANTSSVLRKRALESKQLTNGHTQIESIALQRRAVRDNPQA